MNYRVSDLKNDLAGKLHGTNLDKLYNPNGLIENAVRDVIADVDLEETRRKSELPFIYIDNPVFSLPVDINKKKWIKMDINGENDFKMILTNVKNNDVANVDIKTINGFKCAEFQGIKVPESIKLITFDEIENITGTNITEIKRDTYDYIQGLGAVAFDQVSSGNFDVTVSGLEVDLLAHSGESSFYSLVKIPPKANLDSLTLRIGSDSVNWIEMTVDKNIYGTAFTPGWNLVKFNWSGATTLGTIDPSNITFAKFSFSDVSGLPLTGWKIDAINSNIETPSEIEYYSKYGFIDNDGVLSQRIDSDDNIIVFQDSYNLVLYKLCELASQQVHDYGYKPGASEAGYWNGVYKKERKNYVDDIPSSAKRVSVNYYKRRPNRL